MTVTILERVELTIEEFSIGCECLLGMTCDNPATHVVRFWCDCFKLMCHCCVSAVLFHNGSHLGRIARCPMCDSRTQLLEISDVIKSIDPI